MARGRSAKRKPAEQAKGTGSHGPEKEENSKIGKPDNDTDRADEKVKNRKR